MSESASRTATRANLGEAKGWTDGYWWSGDGLRLHYRDYAAPPGGEALAPVLCIPGLTRNARDFDMLAPHLATRRRVIAVDLRGRGESALAKDPMTYVPLTYVQDLAALLDDQGIGRFVSIGTSLGGICTMLLAATQPGRLVAAVLNDVGPQIEAEGLDRIKTYVGQGGSQPTWLHAARAVEALNRDIYPDFTIDDWLRMVKRSHRLTAEGRVVADYDPQIAAPFRVPGGEAGVDLWPVLDGLAAVPTLILRGATSDIFADATMRRMLDRLPQAQGVTVPRVGHAPTLDEPDAVAAIDRLIDGIAA